AHDDAPALMAERDAADERRDHRGLRLLDLEDDEVGLRIVGSFEERDPAARPDTPDANDLPGDVDQAEPVEHEAVIVGERLAVGLRRGGDGVDLLVDVLDANEHRRVLDELALSVYHACELRHGAEMILSPGSFRVASDPSAVLRREPFDYRLDLCSLVPEIQH